MQVNVSLLLLFLISCTGQTAIGGNFMAGKKEETYLIKKIR